LTNRMVTKMYGVTHVNFLISYLVNECLSFHILFLYSINISQSTILPIISDARQIEHYSRSNSIKSPVSGAGIVSMRRLMSQVKNVRSILRI